MACSPSPPPSQSRPFPVALPPGRRRRTSDTAPTRRRRGTGGSFGGLPGSQPRAHVGRPSGAPQALPPLLTDDARARAKEGVLLRRQAERNVLGARLPPVSPAGLPVRARLRAQSPGIPQNHSAAATAATSL